MSYVSSVHHTAGKLALHVLHIYNYIRRLHAGTSPNTSHSNLRENPVLYACSR
jgi:hypothetical protein